MGSSSLTHETILVWFGLDVDIQRKALIASSSCSSRCNDLVVLLIEYIIPSAFSFPKIKEEV